MSAIEMRKLMEAVQLNEYLIQEGDPVSSLLSLNVFWDFGDGMEQLVGDEYGNIITDEMLRDPEIKKIMKKTMLLSKLLTNSDKLLSKEEAEAADALWYDGSDSYETSEEFEIMAKTLFLEQLRFVADILGVGKNFVEKY